MNGNLEPDSAACYHNFGWMKTYCSAILARKAAVAYYYLVTSLRTLRDWLRLEIHKKNGR